LKSIAPTLFNMADVAKASPPVDGAPTKSRPEKPDQAKYEADLAAAQKEHAANMDKFVRLPTVTCTCMHYLATFPQN
jgi:hypothetical protein